MDRHRMTIYDAAMSFGRPTGPETDHMWSHGLTVIGQEDKLRSASSGSCLWSRLGGNPRWRGLRPPRQRLNPLHELGPQQSLLPLLHATTVLGSMPNAAAPLFLFT